MASVDYDTARSRWRVRWICRTGRRTTRRFSTEAEAQLFARGIRDDERRGRPGPSPQVWGSGGVRDAILRNVRIDEGGCWIWLRAIGSNGYAQSTRWVGGRATAVSMHRASYEAFVGPIPEGLEIDHLCSDAENKRRHWARTTGATA